MWNKINTIADYTHEHDLDMYLTVESWLPEDEHRKKLSLAIIAMKYNICQEMIDKGRGHVSLQ